MGLEEKKKRDEKSKLQDKASKTDRSVAQKTSFHNETQVRNNQFEFRSPFSHSLVIPTINFNFLAYR